jgi:rRNA maturation protein Rpf1
MGIKNWSTKITVEKTIMEIENILAKHGATHIFKMYDNKGTPTALAFKTN